MVEAELVACMIALPPQLFRTTQIPACLWFLAKDKSSQGAKRLADSRGQVLFIDARAMGTMINRTERVFTTEDIARIAGAYHAWRGTASARAAQLDYEDVPGFCHSATIDEIRKQDHMVAPGRYVGTADTDDSDNEPITDKVDRLTKELLANFDESARLDRIVRAQLEHLNV
jgi:type I restriction enzyme M protein